MSEELNPADNKPVDAKPASPFEMLAAHRLYKTVAADVYDGASTDETTDETTDVAADEQAAIHLYLRLGPYGSVIVDDSPEVDGGCFNLVLENRNGAPYLAVWAARDFEDDPTFTIRLDTGELQQPRSRP